MSNMKTSYYTKKSYLPKHDKSDLKDVQRQRHVRRSRLHTSSTKIKKKGVCTAIPMKLSMNKKQGKSINSGDNHDKNTSGQDSVLKDFKLLNSMQSGCNSSIPDFLDVKQEQKSYWGVFYRQLFPQDDGRETLLKKIIVKTSNKESKKAKRNFDTRPQSLNERPAPYSQKDMRYHSVDLEEPNIERLLEYRERNSGLKSRFKNNSGILPKYKSLRKKLTMALRAPNEKNIKKLDSRLIKSSKKKDQSFQEVLQTPVLLESKRSSLVLASKERSLSKFKKMNSSIKPDKRSSLMYSSTLSQFCHKAPKIPKFKHSSTAKIRDLLPDINEDCGSSLGLRLCSKERSPSKFSPCYSKNKCGQVFTNFLNIESNNFNSVNKRAKPTLDLDCSSASVSVNIKNEEVPDWFLENKVQYIKTKLQEKLKALEGMRSGLKQARITAISRVLNHLNRDGISNLNLKDIQKMKTLLKKYSALVSGPNLASRQGKALKRRIKNFNSIGAKKKVIERILAMESEFLAKKMDKVCYQSFNSSLPSTTGESLRRSQRRPGTSIEIYERSRKFPKGTVYSWYKVKI